IENYERHAKELESQISTYRARLNLTPHTEQQLADVSRGYEESKSNYNSLLQKQNQSQLATSLEQRQQGEQFRILDPPSLPARPSSPNHLLLSLGGLIVGAVLGFGLAALLEMTNVLVRQEKDLEGLVPTRVLVGIPYLNAPGEDRFHTVYHRLEIGTVAVMALLILAGNVFFFYPTPSHNEALALLNYGVLRRKGFVVVTGEVGTGKTLLVRCLLDTLALHKVASAYIYNPLLSVKSFLEQVLT